MTPKKQVRQTKASPFYEQVANILRARITGDEADQPVRLPTERELCEIHHVSRITIRQALDLLEQQGLVQRTPGRGTLTVPDAIHRWNRLRRKRLIHVITGWQDLETIPNSYYGQIYQGIFARAEQAGYRPAIRQVEAYRTDRPKDPYLPELDSCLGILFVGMMNDPTIQLYVQAGYPVVCIDYWSHNPLADSIVVDCYSEGQQAVDFLLRQGHRDLFYIGNRLTYRPPAEKESDAVLVLAGMQRALDVAGLPMLPEQRIRFAGQQSEYARAEAEWLASLQPRPTAGVIFNSRTCDLIVEALKGRGIRCPEDISVVTKTWSGDPSSVASLRSDAHLLGELAVEALLDRAAGRRPAGLCQALPSQVHRGRTIRQVDP